MAIPASRVFEASHWAPLESETSESAGTGEQSLDLFLLLTESWWMLLINKKMRGNLLAP